METEQAQSGGELIARVKVARRRYLKSQARYAAKTSPKRLRKLNCRRDELNSALRELQTGSR